MFTWLGQLLGFLVGTAKIVEVEHMIDFNAAPFVPSGWKVKRHIKGGKVKWDPANFALYLSEGQQDGKTIQGHKLRKELKKGPVYNANLLDYLLAYTEFIPEGCKGKFVFFWGTIYSGPGGTLRVRCLRWYDCRWDSSFGWLDGFFGAAYPAAVPEST